MNEAPSPARQRLCLVLPTTAEFDSRTYRIASAFAARGHEVTVVARLGPGLPLEETVAAGYRIIRVPVSAVDGLPLPAWARRRIAALHGRSGTAAAGVAAGMGDPGGMGDRADRTTSGSATAESRRAPRFARAAIIGDAAGRARRAFGSLARIAAITLTVRSQERASRAVAPAADLYHGMAYMGIPVALALAKRAGRSATSARHVASGPPAAEAPPAAPRAAARRPAVIYDARDIYVDANNLARLPRPARRLLGWIERRWARRADRVVTVNRPYAEVMAERFGVPLPAIVMNCSYRFDPGDPPALRFHDVLHLPPDRRVILYQGGFARERGIEQLFSAIAAVPNAVLVLLGYGPLEAELRARAADPSFAGLVHVLPAVPPNELLSWVAAADVVAMPIQPATLNHRLTTPNKLFEAMAAGVPVIASDLPGMAGIVTETRCGILVDPSDPGAIAAAARQILDAPPDERRALRRRALAAAHEAYNWEAQVEVLASEYRALTGAPW